MVGPRFRVLERDRGDFLVVDVRKLAAGPVAGPYSKRGNAIREAALREYVWLYITKPREEGTA